MKVEIEVEDQRELDVIMARLAEQKQRKQLNDLFLEAAMENRLRQPYSAVKGDLIA